MYRTDAWSQGDGALWAPGSSGGAEVRPGAGTPRVQEAREEDAGASLFDFDESDLDGVASY
jgi:hypothetical protein